jgi:NAD(P)-dependent dehydrogenase (short-subunit alcohol dehydrogenase family)
VDPADDPEKKHELPTSATPQPGENHETVEQIVLVTGGTSGIGLEAAKLFREEGATVIIVGQNPDRLQSVAGQFGDSVTVLRRRREQARRG